MKLMSKDLRENERITTFFALGSLELRKSKRDKYYLVADLYDISGRLKGFLWNDALGVVDEVKAKTFVKVRGVTNMINGSLAINIEQIRTVTKEEIDIRDFLDVVPGGIDLWHKKLMESVNLIREVNCARIVEMFLEDDGFLELFLTSPAGISIHHNYIGGLLEHTASTMAQAAFFAEKNPGLIDRDLLITGAFLHDIGKTQEIYWEITREYTTQGKLLGHIVIGLLLLENKLAKIADFPNDLSLLLKHMILSHHGELEYGSPVTPATPEALALHIIDNTDAKTNHMYCHLKNSDPTHEWSSYDRYINKEIYQAKFKKTVKELSKKVAA